MIELDRPARLLAAAIAAATLAGCLGVPLDPDYTGPAQRPDAIEAPFRYERSGAAASITVGEPDEDGFRRVTFGSAVNFVDEHDLKVDLIDPGGETPRPLVLVLPILGGGNRIAKHFARHFAEKGFAAAIVHRQEDYKDTTELDELNRVFRQIVVDHMQVLDWLETQEGIDAQRVGVFGVSAGAVKGALVYGLDDRVDAAVLALVGGDLGYVLAYSKEEGIVETREKAMARHGITREELYDALHEGFEHDPLKYAPYMDARHALIILARFDAVIPHRTGKALREAMGGPETVLLPTGHYGAIIFTPYMKDKAVEYFRRKLSDPAVTGVSLPGAP